MIVVVDELLKSNGQVPVVDDLPCGRDIVVDGVETISVKPGRDRASHVARWRQAECDRCGRPEQFVMALSEIRAEREYARCAMCVNRVLPDVHRRLSNARLMRSLAATTIEF